MNYMIKSSIWKRTVRWWNRRDYLDKFLLTVIVVCLVGLAIVSAFSISLRLETARFRAICLETGYPHVTESIDGDWYCFNELEAIPVPRE